MKCLHNPAGPISAERYYLLRTEKRRSVSSASDTVHRENWCRMFFCVAIGNLKLSQNLADVYFGAAEYVVSFNLNAIYANFFRKILL